jgi:hypothetical protein
MGIENTLYVYDIASDTWSQGANLPDVVWGAFMGAWDGKLYLAGGSRGDVPYVPVDRVDVYDIATDTWTAGGGTPMPVATDFAGSVQAGPYLYIAGGVVGDGIHLHNETQRYNMATGDWEQGPDLTIPQWGAGLAISGSRLYILGGSDDIVTWNPLDKVDVLELVDWPGGAWADLGDPLSQVNLYPATACTHAMAGGEIWAAGGGLDPVNVYNTNLYRPAEPCFDFYFGDLNPESLQGEGYSGGTVTYEVNLTNNGTLTDTYDLAVSGNTWPTEAPATVGPLASGESTQVVVSVDIPIGTPIGDSDSVMLTATSQGDPALADSSIITTTAISDWTEAEPIPEPFMGWSVQCPEQLDSFYMVGGLTVGGIDSNHLYRYDADSNDWTQLVSMPQPRRAASVACYQGRIYVAGGVFGGVWGSLFIYDITSNTWSLGANLPNAVWGAFIGAWDGKLYLAGGSRTFGNYPPVNRVDVYDIATNTWTAGGGTSMPVATDFAGSVQAGQYLYIAGGLVGDGIHLHDKTQRYDMATDTWELGPDLTIPQWGAGLAVTDSRLYLLGGSDNVITWNPLDKVDVLELADWPGGVWTGWDPLPQVNLYPASACTEAVVGGEIWAAGGGPNLEMIYDTNLYHPAEPCVSFGVSLAPEGLELDGYPGDTVDYALTLTNTGNTTDYFRLTASSLWSITLPETVGPLGAGESAMISVSVTIPPDAGAGDMDVAIVTAASIGNSAEADSSTLTTTANPVYNLELEPGDTALSGMPGEAVTFSVQISNQGNISDTYDLDCLDEEWPMDMPVTQVTLAVGESADVVLTVHIPVQAMPGQRDAMTFTAVSQGDPAEAQSAELTTTVTGNLLYLPVIVR